MQTAELIKEIEKLESGERNEFLRTLFLSGIVRTADVCGGAARINRTRIPVWAIERMRQLGGTESVMLKSFPSLTAIDLAQALLYAELHREEIEKEILENEVE